MNPKKKFQTLWIPRPGARLRCGSPARGEEAGLRRGRLSRLAALLSALLLAVSFLAAPLPASAAYDLPEDVSISAKAALVVSLGPTQAEDTVLYERDADAMKSPAALVRLMVGAVAIQIIREQEIDMDATTGTYTIDCFNRIAGTGLTTANMEIGETWTVRDLLSMSMIQTAENLAAQYHISREDCDAFALRSHRLAARAWSEGLFDRQVVPVTVPRRKGPPEQVRTDDCVRPGCTLEELARLKPVLGQGGVVTAGNSSPKNDGASAMLVLSERRAAEWGLKPLGRVAAFASAGCHPHYMGWGPVAATRKLLDQTGLRLADFDLIELNEAFAAQSLACLRELGLDNPADMERVNVNGGAIAIGHPNAASGGILTARILYELERRNARRGLITFCIGGGQGMSLVVERE